MSVAARPPGTLTESGAATNLASQSFRFSIFEVDPRRGELRRDGVKIRLQKKSLQLLLILIHHAGEVVLREELRAGLWPADTFVDFDANIKTAVNRLRKALGDSAENPVFIETIPRTGFRFIAPVTRVGQIVRSSSPAESATTQVVALSSIEGLPNRTHPVWSMVAVFAAVLAVVPIGFFMLGSRFSEPKRPGKPLVLLVLPFEDLSGDGKQQSFSDGVTDEMITFLGERAPRELSVIARTSAMRYQGTHKPVSQIAKELGGADYVLEGSVRRSGSHIGINTELVRAPDQAVLWAQTYDSEVADLLTVQQDVAQRVSQSLFNRLVPMPLSSSHVPDSQAHDSYLMGKYYQQNKRNGENLLKSLEYFQQAIQQDPNYAAPHAGLAYSYMVAAGWEMLKPADAYPKAMAAAERALQLDPNLAEPHESLATAEHEYYWKWAEAEAEFRRAIELNPNSSLAHKGYAEFLMHAGRNRAAIEEVERAVSLDPLALGIRLLRAFVYLFAHEYERAEQECAAIIRIDSQYAPAYYLLGGVYVAQRRYDDALAQFKIAEVFSGESPKMLAAVART